MAALMWFSLAFCLVAVVASTVVAAMRGLRLWRSFRTFSALASEVAGDAAARAGALEPRVVALQVSTDRLEVARERLRRSTAELAILADAASEAQSFVRLARGAVPSK